MQRYVYASILGFLTAMATPAFAEPEPAAGGPRPADVTVRAPAPRLNSVNGHPWGILIGAYSVNYERLLGPTHGVMVEGEYVRFGGDEDYVTSYGGNVGYRWHWSGGQDSGFLGANLGYRHGGAGVSGGGEAHSLSVDTVYVVMNVGRRFAWRSGFNITLRIGGGRAWHSVTAESDNPDAEEAEETIEKILNFIPVALDGELSVGYAF